MPLAEAMEGGNCQFSDIVGGRTGKKKPKTNATHHELKNIIKASNY